MDDAAERYQGAAIARLNPDLGIGVGVSGLPSAADEAIATRSLLDAKYIDRARAEEYRARSNNPYWRNLR